MPEATSESAMSCTIDIDRPETWPAEVRREANRMAESLAGATPYTADLRLPEHYDDEFRRLLAGHRLRAYHATRLLPHEIEDVRSGGLRCLTRDLVARRLQGLQASGLVTDSEVEELGSRTVFALGNYENRQDQTCFVLGNFSFRKAGLCRLLETWGGEAIFWGIDRNHPLRERLRSVGEPVVVAAELEGFDAGSRVHAVFPALPKLFIAAALNLDDEREASVMYRAAVPHDRIEAVWCAGDVEFNRRVTWI
jgi:hypothetical protein